MTPRPGVTLVELLVVIALLAVIASVSGLAFGRARGVRGVDASVAAVMVLRDSALKTGRVVTGVVTLAQEPAASARGRWRSVPVAAYPDGRVLVDGAVGIDAMSGGVVDAAP